MKLQTRMLLLFSMLFSLGFFFLVLLTTSAITDTNRQMVDSFSTQSFEFKAQEVGAWLGQRITELRMIAMNDSLQEGKIENAVPYIARLNGNVGIQYGNEWGTFAIGYLDGIGWVSEDRYIDISERDYFHEAIEGEQEYVLSAPVVSRTDQADISLICYPLRDGREQVYGFLNAAIRLHKLDEIVSELEFYDGRSWIMDGQGRVYAASGQWDRNGAAENFPEGLLQELEKAKPEGARELRQGSQTVFYTPIPYTSNWYLCTTIASNVLMRDTRQLMLRLAVLFLAVMILLFICCILLSRSITRPLHQLMEAMREVEKGKWDVSLRQEGQDELAQLIRSFDKMVKRVHGLMQKSLEDEREKREAELRALQVQINPHFLYNTLDTLLYMADEDDNQEMVEMIRSLSTFFRISLSRGKEIIPLEKEIEHVKSYLSIQKIRFQDILNYEFEVEVQDSFQVLKLILQPLAENAVQHGIRQKMSPGNIHIHIWQEKQMLYMEVADDGAGMSRERMMELQRELEEGTPGKSYGLINVSNRIKLLYGEKAEITVWSEEGVGTTVCIILPGMGEEHV